MITFNDIYDASRNERYSEKLQPLSEDFVSDVAEYLNDKREMSLKEKDIFSDVIDKTKKQAENATTLFKELMNRRRKKILGLILIASETGISKKDFDNMLSFEKELFEGLMECMNSFGNKIGNVLNGKNGEKNKIKENDFLKIKFKEDVEEFVNLDGNVIGPFSKGQSADIAESVARILIEGGRAEELTNKVQS